MNDSKMYWLLSVVLLTGLIAYGNALSKQITQLPLLALFNKLSAIPLPMLILDSF